MPDGTARDSVVILYGCRGAGWLSVMDTHTSHVTQGSHWLYHQLCWIECKQIVIIMAGWNGLVIFVNLHGPGPGESTGYKTLVGKHITSFHCTKLLHCLLPNSLGNWQVVWSSTAYCMLWVLLLLLFGALSMQTRLCWKVQQILCDNVIQNTTLFIKRNILN